MKRGAVASFVLGRFTSAMASWPNRQDSRGHRSSRQWRLSVDEGLQLLSRLEIRNLLGRDVDGAPGLRVAALPPPTTPHPKAPQAAQLHFAVLAPPPPPGGAPREGGGD